MSGKAQPLWWEKCGDAGGVNWCKCFQDLALLKHEQKSDENNSVVY